MNIIIPFIFTLLSMAAKQALIALISERLLKDVVVVALEKLSKSTKNHVDNELCEVVKRALYPEFEAGQPPTLEQLSVAQKKLEDSGPK